MIQNSTQKPQIDQLKFDSRIWSSKITCNCNSLHAICTKKNQNRVFAMMLLLCNFNKSLHFVFRHSENICDIFAFRLSDVMFGFIECQSNCMPAGEESVLVLYGKLDQIASLYLVCGSSVNFTGFLRQF